MVVSSSSWPACGECHRILDFASIGPMGANFGPLLPCREMAVGNTFGATALSSYGGFWISYALILTPSLGIVDAYSGSDANSAIGFFLTGWFIFTTILLLCTLRSTIMFFSLFFTLDLAFLFLFCAEYATNNGAATTAIHLQKAGGVFGMLAAFLAWYNAFAGIADSRLVLSLHCTLHTASALHLYRNNSAKKCTSLCLRPWTA